MPKNKVKIMGHSVTMTHRKADGTTVGGNGQRAKRFTKRFMPTDGSYSSSPFRHQLARMIARLVAEDANTAYYVQQYIAGEHDSRADYIEYMADRIEFEMRRAGFL